MNSISTIYFCNLIISHNNLIRIVVFSPNINQSNSTSLIFKNLILNYFYCFEIHLSNENTFLNNTVYFIIYNFDLNIHRLLTLSNITTIDSLIFIKTLIKQYHIHIYIVLGNWLNYNRMTFYIDNSISLDHYFSLVRDWRIFFILKVIFWCCLLESIYHIDLIRFWLNKFDIYSILFYSLEYTAC